LGEVVSRVNVTHVEGNFLLLLTDASCLATTAGEEVLLFARECLSSRPLLIGTFIGLASREAAAADSKFLLGEISQIFFVALGLDFWLGRFFITRCSCIAAGTWGPGFTICILWCRDAAVKAFLLFFLSNGLTRLLVSELGVARCSTPSMGYLLCVVGDTRV